MATASASKASDTRAPAEPNLTSNWFARFVEFGQSPSISGFMSLLNNDVIVVDSGLSLSYSGDSVEASISKLLAAIPDLRIKPIRHRIRNNSIFVETENSGSHGGEKLAWDACYVATLTGSRATRLRIFADHAVMLRPFLKDAPAFPGYSEVWEPKVDGIAALPAGRWDPRDFIDAYQAVWRNPSPMGFTNFYTPGGTILNPGFRRPIVKAEVPGYYDWVMRRVPHVEMALVDWAGDQDLIYAEWVGSGLMGNAPFTMRVVDVFHFDEAGVSFGQAYYDTLKTVARLDPSVVRHRDAFFLTTS